MTHPREAVTLNACHNKIGPQIPEWSTLHQISKTGGFTSPGEVSPPTTVMGQDNAWQEALSPRLMAAGHKTVQGVG
jgi:hypothetical protein